MSPTECGKTECDRGTSQRRPKSTLTEETKVDKDCRAIRKKNQTIFGYFNDAMSTIEIKHHTVRYGTSPKVT